jgi:hypothetical protein
VKFTVKAPEHLTVRQCTCSLCLRKGYKHLFLGAGHLTFIRGEEHLKDYEFAGKNIVHQVCYL